MGFDQYHEPPEELSAETRTFARLCASLEEESQAIGWYQQRLDVEADPEARAIMADAQGEEFKHFAMDLEFLLRRTPRWRHRRSFITRSSLRCHSSSISAVVGMGLSTSSTSTFSTASMHETSSGSRFQIASGAPDWISPAKASRVAGGSIPSKAASAA